MILPPQGGPYTRGVRHPICTTLKVLALRVMHTKLVEIGPELSQEMLKMLTMKNDGDGQSRIGKAKLARMYKVNKIIQRM